MSTQSKAKRDARIKRTRKGKQYISELQTARFNAEEKRINKRLAKLK